MWKGVNWVGPRSSFGGGGGRRPQEGRVYEGFEGGCRRSSVRIVALWP